MTPQSFVKKEFPNAKCMYRDEAGYAIMWWSENLQKNIILGYGNSAANAWLNLKKHIESNIKKNKKHGI